MRLFDMCLNVRHVDMVVVVRRRLTEPSDRNCNSMTYYAFDVGS